MERVQDRHLRWLPVLLVTIGSIVEWWANSSATGVVIRTAAFLVLMAPMPSINLLRVSGYFRDRLEFIVAAIVTSLAFIGATGFFIIDDVGQAWKLHVVLLAYVGLTLLTTLIVGPGSVAGVRGRGASSFALALSVAVAGSAMLVHFLVPAAPVETAFDMVVKSATISPREVTVTVDVAEVGQSGPALLYLSADYHNLSQARVTRSGLVTLTGYATPQTGSLCKDLIKISAPNSSYLTPALTCRQTSSKPT